MKEKHIAIIGAEIAGMESAILLNSLGYRVTIFEKEKKAGGHLKHWNCLFPDFADPASIYKSQVVTLKEHAVKIYYQTEITDIKNTNNRFELMGGNEMSVFADAVLVASGFKLFNAELKEEYGYKLFDNVFTSKDLELAFKKNSQLLPSNGKKPERIAIIHCVGSRDAKSGNTYCSKVCCITGIKQAIKLSRLLPDCEIFCFYIDLRLNDSGFDDLYLEAQKKHKIQFIRGRLSEACQRENKTLQIKAEDTLSGRPLRMNVDMLILLVGIEPGLFSSHLTNKGFIKADDDGFIQKKNRHYQRNSSSQNGVFMAGTCTGPMSVSETIENARSASYDIVSFLNNNIVNE